MDKIKEISDDSIDLVITSPPYWSLRDYEVKGQWGSESDFNDYLDNLINLTSELKRVIKPTGSIWVNLGDTYGQNKDKLMIPYRYAIRCSDELGLACRNDAIWAKPNAMPQSSPDRLTNKYESLFFMVKNTKTNLLWQHKTTKKWYNTPPLVDYKDSTQRGKTWRYSVSKNKESLYRGFTYYFNLDSIREKCLTEVKTKTVKDSRDKTTQMTFGTPQQKAIREKYKDKPQSNVSRLHKDRAGSVHQKYTPTAKQPLTSTGKVVEKYKDYKRKRNPVGKNPGDIFTISTRPLAAAHTAAFPVELPTKIIKACCPPDGIVLDPFFGAGTTGVAAEILERQWVGIELNPEYIKIANDRLFDHVPQSKMMMEPTS